MITIHIHYSDGTQSITGDLYTGYEPSRRDSIITAHIATQDGYNLYIDQHSLVLKYKYITLEHSRFSIGKYVYPITSLCLFKGTEKNHLNRLRDLRDEVMNHGTVDGEAIPYRLRKLIAVME